jgi:hypothetical protein
MECRRRAGLQVTAIDLAFGGFPGLGAFREVHLPVAIDVEALPEAGRVALLRQQGPDLCAPIERPSCPPDCRQIAQGIQGIARR